MTGENEAANKLMGMMIPSPGVLGPSDHAALGASANGQHALRDRYPRQFVGKDLLVP
jgi:hypothetical protein